MLPLARPVAAQNKIAATRFLYGQVSKLFGAHMLLACSQSGMQGRDRESLGRSRNAFQDHNVTL